MAKGPVKSAPKKTHVVILKLGKDSQVKVTAAEIKASTNGLQIKRQSDRCDGALLIETATRGGVNKITENVDPKAKNIEPAKPKRHWLKLIVNYTESATC